MLAALGARFLDADGEPVAPGAAARDLATADLSALDPRLADVDLVLASDVDNPLTGPQGRPAVYGPQKGASPDDVAALDAALAHYARVLEKTIGAQAAEAAPLRAPARRAASATARWSASRASFRPGIEVMLDVLGFAPRWPAPAGHHRRGLARRADPARQGPGGVAAAASAAGVPVVAVCGGRDLSDELLHGAGFAASYVLADLEPDLRACLARPAPLLERVGRQIAEDRLAVDR